MKVGDKLFCKKTFYGNHKQMWVSIGNTYSVLYNDNSRAYYIIDNQGDVNESILTNPFLDKYFMNKKEIRKMKLNKLNSYEQNL